MEEENSLQEAFGKYDNKHLDNTESLGNEEAEEDDENEDSVWGDSEDDTPDVPFRESESF
ncbi:MAG: hypothetical protein JKX80_02565 [Candidatus Pacebacteria bacterium]|nr:hypothetical protein [Candidatus Paceibacterota bacterium]